MVLSHLLMICQKVLFLALVVEKTFKECLFDITGPAPAPIACRILPKRSIFKSLAIKHTILPIRNIIKHIVITYFSEIITYGS